MNEYKINHEIDLFLLFYELERLIYLLQSRLDNKIIPESSTKHVQAVLKELGKRKDQAFGFLSEFGVNPFKMNGQTITEEYRAWYKWWEEYLFSLDEELIVKILKNSLNEEEKKKIVPAGNWRDLIGKC